METRKSKVTIKDAVHNDYYCPIPLDVFPNYMGINLVSIDSVEWVKQEDGQLVTLTVNFIPNNDGTIEEIAEEFYSEQSKAYEDAIEPMFDNSRYLVAGFIDGAKWQQEQAKQMEKEHRETHKYTEFDIINAFEYGWNQYGWNKQQYGIMDEDKIHRIQKRLIQSLNETKQQEQ